jgi:hypothetical protein
MKATLKTKPVIIRAMPEAVNYRASMDSDYKFKTEIDYLLLPLTPASRRAAIKAMAKGMCSIYPAPEEYYNKTQEAEAALAALEQMAKPCSPSTKRGRSAPPSATTSM